MRLTAPGQDLDLNRSMLYFETLLQQALPLQADASEAGVDPFEISSFASLRVILGGKRAGTRTFQGEQAGRRKRPIPSPHRSRPYGTAPRSPNPSP